MATDTSPNTQRYASRAEGIDSTNNPKHGPSQGDPFAAQRTADNNPFAEDAQKRTDDSASAVAGGGTGSPLTAPVNRDRRESKEWDASKVPPSRFQKLEGSIYATPSSRDGHVDRNTQRAYAEKLKEKGWA